MVISLYCIYLSVHPSIGGPSVWTMHIPISDRAARSETCVRFEGSLRRAWPSPLQRRVAFLRTPDPTRPSDMVTPSSPAFAGRPPLPSISSRRAPSRCTPDMRAGPAAL
ncbi:hypothetical protein HETIRDRAFT_434967 [Heterobasidion irregulare TC 32-1]|uniref:Uncharacterized protein n=1 Tax=Heterobasidion irregulare (strain TC 32-1) TaxID=747525 RepID=W4K5Y6_HETIT|nr:uncharacterized protein HETIRDRAFT_434967 [Heterobasidion irregulare TC 32-1]ETW81217.1 hypothetical protein HETIRDRAFT_434967 [Heterobasidion irregulare TC 32-1]